MSKGWEESVTGQAKPVKNRGNFLVGSHFQILLPLFFSGLLPDNMHAAAAKSRQSCPTLCDPIDGSPPGSPVPGILQARTLEWVAISFCNAWKWKMKVELLIHVLLLATPWTAAYQAPPSMGFSRQEYWSGVPLPSQDTMHRVVKIRPVFSPTIILFKVFPYIQGKILVCASHCQKAL